MPRLRRFLFTGHIIHGNAVHPMGLRICRPETGLVHASEKMNGIHGISSGLCPRPSEAKEQGIEVRLILRGLCTNFVQFE